MTVTTGPKISSRAIEVSLEETKRVGSTNQPRGWQAGRRPPNTKRAPSFSPSAIRSSTRCWCDRDASGPIVVASLNGLPMTRADAVARNRSTTSSTAARGTSIRVSALQIWPEL